MNHRLCFAERSGEASTAAALPLRIARRLAAAIGYGSLLGLLAWPAAASAVPVEETETEAAKGDLVVTMFTCSLQDEGRVLQTIPAGTELRVNDVNGMYIAVQREIDGRQTSGWVHASNVRTPAMLARLKALGDTYQGYALWAETYSTRPQFIALNRLGDPKPMPNITVNLDGTVQSSTVEPTDAQKQRAGAILDARLRSYFVGRYVGGIDADSTWTVLISCGPMKVVSSGNSLRIYQYGELFLIHRQKQRLVYQKSFAGEGPTEAVLLSDFARQAAEEYGKVAARIWWPGLPPGPFAKPRPLMPPGPPRAFP